MSFYTACCPTADQAHNRQFCGLTKMLISHLIGLHSHHLHRNYLQTAWTTSICCSVREFVDWVNVGELKLVGDCFETGAFEL